jgi:hypothetical protein
MPIMVTIDRDLDIDGIQCTNGNNVHVKGVNSPDRWRPSGYVNPYRLPPYESADIFERLTSVDCWPNELNESARRTLIALFYLLVMFLGMLPLVLLYAAAERVS